MRISPINNYHQINSVSFGRFADENAREVLKKTLTADPNKKYMQSSYDEYFGIIDKCPFFVAFTDKNKIVRGEFEDQFVKNADRKITRRIENLKRRGCLQDLSKFDNAEEVASDLKDINAILDGVDLAARYRLKDPHGDATAKEAEKQARIDNLAD